MTRLQAVILTAVFALAGCIDDGLDADESTDNEDCTTEMSWAYCDAPQSFLGWDGHMSEVDVPCGRDEVFIIEGAGAIWSKTCEFVCLSACE